PRRLWRAPASAGSRWIPENRMQLATVAEAAALAGLPGEPSAYGLPAAASRRVPASPDIFTAPPGFSAGGARPVRRSPAARSRPPVPAPPDDLDDSPPS